MTAEKAPKKYIELELAKDAINVANVANFIVEAMQSFLDEVPAADVEEVVRCKDCKYARKVRNRNLEDCDYICCYFRNDPNKMGVVDYYRFRVRPDGYCYRGAIMDKEKKE